MATAWLTLMNRRLIPNKLQSRLLLTYLVVMILGLGGLILWTGIRLQESLIEQEEHDLELQAALIANVFQEPLHEIEEGEAINEANYLRSILRSFSLEDGVHITVLDSRLRVLITTGNPAIGYSSLDDAPPELIDARQGIERHDIRQIQGQDGKYTFVAVPIFSGEDRPGIVGVVQMDAPFGPVASRIRGMWLGLLAAGAVVMAFTALVSIFLAERLAAPIKQLTDATEAMAAGDLNQQVVPKGPEEIERLAKAFNGMAERVRESLAMQQAFVSDAAHELRSPLTGTRLRIEMLKDYSDTDNETMKEYLEQLLEDMDYLQGLVDHLLTLSRLDQSQVIPPTDIDLAPLLYDLADEMRILFQTAGLTIDVDVPHHLPIVNANPEAMRRVVRNLLDNAIQYTQPGGSVNLHADSLDGMVRIIVSDNGQGIPPEDVPHIFERFYRVDKARSRRQGGVGLGLSLVRTITESYGGSVAVESTLEKGATFTISLPMSRGVQEAMS